MTATCLGDIKGAFPQLAAHLLMYQDRLDLAGNPLTSTKVSGYNYFHIAIMKDLEC